MKCLFCSGKMIEDTRDIPYFYKGEMIVIQSVTGNFCGSCGEAVLDAASSRRVSDEMLEFNRQVNAAIVDPRSITRIRKKLSLNQKEAAEIFGGGINAFSRYEKGKARPPLSLIKLLKLLDRHPDLLQEIRAA